MKKRKYIPQPIKYYAAVDPVNGQKSIANVYKKVNKEATALPLRVKDAGEPGFNSFGNK